MDSIGRVGRAGRAVIFHTIQLRLFGESARERGSARGVGGLRLQGLGVVVQLKGKGKIHHLKLIKHFWLIVMLRGEADLNVHSWNVEDGGLHVVALGLQGGGTFLASEQMCGRGVGGLQLLLLGRRLLVQLFEAALTAPTTHTGDRESYEGLLMP